MTLPIAREFAKLGICVLTVAPGIIKLPTDSISRLGSYWHKNRRFSNK